ncbi:hypothetical protein RND81_01G028800 [Saponaria officinalis]|uniref:S-protein homolog n=1 Tax=Saponaria officinalis TaxID=3572 RepID=A0AAW1NB48_SAPOF
MAISFCKNNAYLSLHSLILILVLALVLVVAQSNNVTNCEFMKYIVHVVNDLPNNEALKVHCKSKDTDLGEHILGTSQEVNWSFRVNVFCTTLYYCDMQWSKAHGRFNVFEGIDADLTKACNYKDCSWRVRVDGVFLYNVLTKYFEHRYKW